MRFTTVSITTAWLREEWALSAVKAVALRGVSKGHEVGAWDMYCKDQGCSPVLVRTTTAKPFARPLN